MLGFRSRQSQLQVAHRASSLDFFEQGLRNRELKDGVLRADEYVIVHFRRFRGFPFLKSSLPILRVNVGNAVIERLLFPVIENPFVLQAERFLVRERICRELVCLVETVYGNSTYIGSHRIRTSSPFKQSLVIDQEIEYKVVGQARLGTENSPIRNSENRFPVIGRSKLGHKAVDSKGLDPVTVGQALITKPTAEGRIIGIEQARRKQSCTKPK